MQYATRLQVLSALAALSFGGCRSSDTEPTASFAHSYVFETVLGITPADKLEKEQPSTQLRGFARLNSSNLEMSFDTEDEEKLQFSIARGQLTGNFVGRYPLAEPEFNTPGADVVYTYLLPEGTVRHQRVYSNQAGTARPTAGWVEITHYNAQSQRISGNYHVSFSFVPNPKGASATGPATHRIQLTGRFENLRLL